MKVKVYTTNNETFLSKCAVCGQIYDNWVSSTPCCGSLAYVLTEKDFRKDKLNKIISNINNK